MFSIFAMKFYGASLVVYKKAYDTSRARRTRLTRINLNQNHNKHHTPGIII